MKLAKYCFIIFFTFFAMSLNAQVDKKEVRRGNRDYKKENYKEAEIDYRRALVKDSLSFAANYNLASTLYKMGDNQNAMKSMQKIEETAAANPKASDYYYNLGDIALANKDYKTAVDAFQKSLLISPNDLDAKENYIYAKKMLEQQQNQQNNQDQNGQNQDQNQNDQNNQDKNQNQNQNNQDQNKDSQDQNNQNKDQNKDQNNQNQNNDQNQQQGNNQQSGQEPKISPQAAQQMLQAIQAKEKETQEKVKKEKAAMMQSRQKEKNW